MSGDDPYVYPGSSVLINKFNIRDAGRLAAVERVFVTQRVTNGVPDGGFDLTHLRAIHRHIFQDIYDWAGELRMVEIAKGGQSFLSRQFIERGMEDISRRLRQTGFLLHLNRAGFARAAAEIMGDVNYVHPFREGNGRTQLLYFEQLAAFAGRPVDLKKINAARWIAASRAAHEADYGPMAAEIERCLIDKKD